ncbi:MAG: hypothetical protein R3F36_03905 [Candidatus Competibacteraceae bacterium]
MALQQREQEETDRHAQEAAQQREAEIALSRTGPSGDSQPQLVLGRQLLNRAAAIDPNHPAVVAARSNYSPPGNRA